MWTADSGAGKFRGEERPARTGEMKRRGATAPKAEAGKEARPRLDRQGELTAAPESSAGEERPART